MSSSSTVSPSVVITRDKTSRQDKMLAVNIYTCICFLIVSVREFWTVCPHSPRLVYGQSHLFCRRRERERERERDALCIYVPLVNEAKNHAKPDTTIKDCVCVSQPGVLDQISEHL